MLETFLNNPRYSQQSPDKTRERAQKSIEDIIIRKLDSTQRKFKDLIRQVYDATLCNASIIEDLLSIFLFYFLLEGITFVSTNERTKLVSLKNSRTFLNISMQHLITQRSGSGVCQNAGTVWEVYLSGASEIRCLVVCMGDPVFS
jgi:hypothetical protein